MDIMINEMLEKYDIDHSGEAPTCCSLLCSMTTCFVYDLTIVPSTFVDRPIVFRTH